MKDKRTTTHEIAAKLGINPSAVLLAIRELKIEPAGGSQSEPELSVTQTDRIACHLNERRIRMGDSVFLRAIPRNEIGGAP